ncbi:hypothetical protein QUB47_01085 [Microcoleus sp. AT9_B5]
MNIRLLTVPYCDRFIDDRSDRFIDDRGRLRSRYRSRASKR